MLDALTEGLVLLDDHGRIIDWNAAAITTLGLSADELSGRTSMDPRWQAIHPDGSPWPGELHPSTLAATTGRVMPEQLMGVHRPSGELVWIQVNARPLHDDAGHAIGALAAFLDVTARVETAQRTDELTARLQSAVERTAIGVALVDPRGRITFTNPRFSQILRATPDQLVGLRLSDLIHPHDPSIQTLRGLEIGRELDFDADVQLLIDGRQTAWVEMHVDVLPPVDGAGATLVQIADVTQRHELEQRIRRSEELARLSLDALDQGVIFASPTLGIQRMNPAATDILGYSSDELFELWQAPTWSMCDEHANPIHAADFAGLRAIDSGEPVRHQILWLLHKDQTWKRVRMSAVPFGWTDEVILFFTDITPFTSPDAPRPPGPGSDGDALQVRET